ncbi:uncharacterized protein LOC114525509 [Dendronephthya gigantea]|uniref:uncharacterized protein LOC114525509 n=1 Tax=Dendronephthya gigantea TaxID=151771 RepID=UPI00106B46B1|nr:uncharacterized protein LOC114525509 [Dendronephthya gigantea]
MSRYKFGLLLSQLLDCISRPLEEEQVWALCYEICQHLSSDSDMTDNPRVLHFSQIVFALETIYIRRDGMVELIPNSNSCGILEDEDRESSFKQMNDLGRVLTICLENGGPKDFLKRQVGGELESLMHDLFLGNFAHESPRQWMVLVAANCKRHASTQTDLAQPNYYGDICELLVKEAMEMNNFLAVVTNEISHYESKHDAFSTFQLTQARPVISNWLQCMSEIKEHNGEAEYSFHSKELFEKENHAKPFGALVNTPGFTSTLPRINEKVESPEPAAFEHSKPTDHSTPTIFRNKGRKVLRPPQRLVNQVTTWMLDQEPQQLKPVVSSLGWFREAKRIRRVLTDLQIDTAMEDDSLYNALRNGDLCFCCRVAKFSLFYRSCTVCEVCERKVCSSCTTNVTSRELGISLHDSTLDSHDSGISSRDFRSCSGVELDQSHNGSLFGQLRKVFKPKASVEESYNVCKDCRDCIQRYF